MAPSPPQTATLLIVDDDLLTLEVLSLMAVDAGYSVQSVESGDAALRLLDAATEAPDAILVDMQMPGMSTPTLLPQLRAACGPATSLIAMSGTVRPDSLIQQFDAFLLKPFSMDELNAAVSGTKLQSKAEPKRMDSKGIEALSEATYESLAQSMPPDQLMALYAMCLDDADRRLESMRAASEARDLDTYHRAAHSIKGGCGMVGALELAALAARMEDNPLPEVGDIVPFEVFLEASARLRSILIAHRDKQSPDRL